MQRHTQEVSLCTRYADTRSTYAQGQGMDINVGHTPRSIRDMPVLREKYQLAAFPARESGWSGAGNCVHEYGKVSKC
eukprot:2447773-Rhodomonas_salina.1